MEFTLEDGKELIKFARKNIENFLEANKAIEIPDTLQEKFSEKMGAFVTLSRRQEGEKLLRGCIGMTLPVFSLIQTVSNVSLSAAFEDPRFSPIKSVDDLVIEISILTVPKRLVVGKPEDYLSVIQVGKDGLYIIKGRRRGLLLPQVPVENNRNWDVKTFLEHTCQKAWLSPDAWKNPKTEIYTFQAIIFEEKSPNGEIHRKEQ